MSKIVYITDRRNKEHTTINGDNRDVDITMVTDFIFTEWEFNFRNDTLDDYISSITKLSIPKRPWTESLDSVKYLMEDIGLSDFVVYSPRQSRYNPLGWLCAFKLPEAIRDMSDGKDDWTEAFSGPEMASEIHARLMAVVFFVEYSRIILEKYKRKV